MATSPLAGASRSPHVQMKIGYIRDRTAVFKEKWDAAHPWLASGRREGTGGGGESDTMALMERGDRHHQGGFSGASSSWVGLETEIQNALTYLRTLLKEFALMQAKARENVFAKKKGDELENKRKEIKRAIRETAAKIEMLHTLPGPADDKAIVERIHRTLGAQLAEVARDFQHSEVSEIRQRSRTANGVGGANMEALLAQVSEPTPAFTEHQMQELESTALEYEQRDKEIASMLTTIHEIAEIMKDMNTLVIEQGTMIDRIDQNIEQAASSIEQGNAQIERANEASKKGNLINVIFCLAMSVVLAVILLMVMKF